MSTGHEAIILAGGLGTRLSALFSDRPKVMVDIGGRPFLEILLARLARQGFARAILATGHLRKIIETHFGSRWSGMDICYSAEERPLGTGGAVWKAMKMACREDVFVFNGDTFFDVDLSRFYEIHHDTGADVSLALKPMRDFDRYGTVELKGMRVVGFREKTETSEGLINGGIYLLNRGVIERSALPEAFSLESDFLEKQVAEITIGGFIQDGYFIDIGIPEDYERACQELPRYFI